MRLLACRAWPDNASNEVLSIGLRFVEQRDLLGGGFALGVELRDEGRVGLGECVEFGGLRCDRFRLRSRVRAGAGGFRGRAR